MVLVGGGVTIWYFAVRPGAPGIPDQLGAAVLTFAYPLASILVLVGITSVLLRGPIDRNRWAFGLLVAGVLLSVIGDLALGLVRIETGERGASLVDAVYLMVYLLMIASVELYHRRPLPRTTETEQYQPRSQPLSPLPYAAVALTFGLLLIEAFRPGRQPVTQLAVGAVAITPPRGPAATARSAPERPAPGRDGGPSERGPLPLPRAALVGRDPRGRVRRDDPVREPLGGPGAALRSGAPPRPRRALAAGGGGPGAGRGVPPRRLPGNQPPGPDRVGVPPARRVGAPDRDDRHQPDRGPHRPRYRAQHPRRQRAEAPRAGAAAPGLPRLADRPRQPRALPGPGQPRAGARAPAGPGHHACCSSTSTTSRR